MTDWVAVSVDIHDDAKIAAFAQALAVPYDSAAMRLIQVWGRLARHENESGKIGHVDEATIEKWAGWRGKAGKFASEFKDRFTTNGIVNGWWNWNGRSLERARKERERKRNLPGSSPRNPRGDSSNNTETKDETGPDLDRTKQTAASSAAREDAAVRCAVAANTGLRRNSKLEGRFNELLPQQAQQLVHDWLSEGIALDLITMTIEKRCAEYEPSVNGDQPKSFKYFDRAIRQAHAQVVGAAQMAGVGAAQPRTASKVRDLTSDE